jgi:hypothetical protein
VVTYSKGIQTTTSPPLTFDTENTSGERPLEVGSETEDQARSRVIGSLEVTIKRLEEELLEVKQSAVVAPLPGT